MTTLKEIKKHITISEGNRKVPFPNLSLPPIKTCKKGIPCAKDCYAMKSFTQYPSVRMAYNKNLSTLKKNKALYFGLISTYIDIKKPSFFRWHVAGDITSRSYFRGMVGVALNHPKSKFLAFTKRPEFVDHKNIPGNLSIVISAWPTVNHPKTSLPIAWMQDGTENRMDMDKCIQCPGNCDNCGACWELKRHNLDVVFDKH